MAAQTYRTRAGDMVDAIAFKHYGSDDTAYIALILEANPGLAKQGPVLPYGLAIKLPESAKAAAGVENAITLWS